MVSVVVLSARGFDDYTFHLVNALASVAKVGYLIDAKQHERFGTALNHNITPIVFNRPRRRQLWGLWEMVQASRAVQRFEPDLFHLQGNGLWENFLLRMIRNIPLIDTVHDPVLHIDYQNYLNNYFLRDAVGRADGWVVHGEGLKQLLVSQFRVDPERILVHPLGIHDYYGHPEAASGQREKIILFFGEPRINKGFDLLLRVFHSVQDRLDGWRLVIAGKGAADPSALAMIRSLGDRVIYENRHISDREVTDLFSRAGIVALPYRHGSTSGVLGIAAALGCPVLATKVGNLPEIMEHEKQVYFVEPDNEQALAQGLIYLVGHPEIRAKLGQNLYELARTDWAWKKIAERTVDFYTRVLSEQKAARSLKRI